MNDILDLKEVDDFFCLPIFGVPSFYKIIELVFNVYPSKEKGATLSYDPIATSKERETGNVVLRQRS